MDTQTQERVGITEGEWTAVRLNADGAIIRKPGWEVRTPNFDVVANVPQGGPIRREADARAIAAVPQMLDALAPFAALARKAYPTDPDTMMVRAVVTLGELRRVAEAFDAARGT